MSDKNGLSDFIKRATVSIVAGLVILAIVGLLVLREEVKANCIKIKRMEPTVNKLEEGISDIKGDIKAIRVMLEYERKKGAE